MSQSSFLDRYPFLQLWYLIFMLTWMGWVSYQGVGHLTSLVGLPYWVGVALFFPIFFNVRYRGKTYWRMHPYAKVVVALLLWGETMRYELGASPQDPVMLALLVAPAGIAALWAYSSESD